MTTSDRGIVGWLALGLLLDGPASGYDLWHRAERSVAHFWPVTRSAFYAELPRLQQRGLATSVDIPQEGYPDKRVYHATAEGRRAFVDWLCAADFAERPRHPHQLMLFFTAHAPSEHTRHLLDRWRQQARGAEEACRRILLAKGVDVDAPRSPAVGDPRLLTALFGLRRARADLAFLEEIEEILIPAAEPGVRA